MNVIVQLTPERGMPSEPRGLIQIDDNQREFWSAEHIQNPDRQWHFNFPSSVNILEEEQKEKIRLHCEKYMNNLLDGNSPARPYRFII